MFTLCDLIEGAEYGPFPTRVEAFTAAIEMDLATGQMEDDEDTAALLLDMDEGLEFIEVMQGLWWDAKAEDDPRPWAEVC